ncbi:MAG: hypothetical protein KDC38_16505 [Planctomycetes bacterium]|nr:hypothetical protein [Planctomycetota bacterium]
MFQRTTVIVLCVAGLVSLNGCLGGIRKTTTPKTATEQLLVSTAIQRAVDEFKGSASQVFNGKKVFVASNYMEDERKPFAESAMRDLVIEAGGMLAGTAEAADLVAEVRTAASGLKDSGFGFGLPELPLPVPNSSLNTVIPALYLFYRDKQEGWAKFRVWVRNASGDYVAKSGDLWGHSYYSQWTFFAIGPFDWSNDIYPEDAPM